MSSSSDPVGRDAPRVSLEKAQAFRLSRHHLAKKALRTALPRVAGDMGGAQAQLPSAAHISLWARIRGLRQADVEKALWEDRTLVRAWCMRGALHLIPSEDFDVFLRAPSHRAAKEAEWFRRAQYDVARVERVFEEMGRALERPLPRGELAARVSTSLGLPLKTGQGRGWGATSGALSFDIGGKLLPLDFLVWVAGIRGKVCFGPNEGNEPTYVHPDRWIPRRRVLPPEEAEAELLRRYLRVHGPATPAEFAGWGFGTTTAARKLWSRLADELASVALDGSPAWVLRDDLPTLLHATIARPCVRLLPYFDSFHMGQRDRRHLVDAAHYRRVYRPAGGWIAPVVLVDARVAGMWAIERKGGRSTIRVEPFRRFSREERDGIEAEAADLGRFLESPTDLVIRR